MEDRSLNEVLAGFSQAAGVLNGENGTPSRPPLPPPRMQELVPPLPAPLPPPPPIRPVPVIPTPPALLPPLPPLPGMAPMPMQDPMGSAMSEGYNHVAYNTPRGSAFAQAARMHTLSSAPLPPPPPMPMTPVSTHGRMGHGGVDPLLPLDSMYRVPTYGNFNRGYDAAQYNASAIRQLQVGGDLAYQQYAGRAMLAAGGSMAGMAVGGLAGGYFGPRGALWGMQAGELVGGLAGMSDSASTFVGAAMRPVVDRRLEAMRIQGASQNFVLGGTQLDPLGRGLSAHGSQQLQEHLRTIAESSGGALNQADLGNIMSVSGDLGLLKDAQTADQIARTVKDITSVLGTFAKVTGDPDFRNNLEKIAELKRYGFSIHQSASVLKDLDAYGRASGQTVRQLMDGAAGAGASMFQGSGLTAGGGLVAGALASAQTRAATAAGSYTDIQKALYGGDTGITQALTSTQAAFISGPGQALLPYITKRGSNGIELDQDAIKRLSLGQVSYDEAIREGGARISGDSGYMQELLFKQRELLAEFDQKTGPMGTQSMIFAQARKMSEQTGMDMSTAMSAIVGRDNAQVMLTAAQDPEYWQNMLRQQQGELARRQYEAGEANTYRNRGTFGSSIIGAAHGVFGPESMGTYDRMSRWLASGDEDAQLASINQRRGRFDMSMRLSRVGTERRDRTLRGRSAGLGWDYQTTAGADLAGGYMGEDFARGYDTLTGSDAYLLDTYGTDNGWRLGLGTLEDAAKYGMSNQTHAERQSLVSDARTMQQAYLGMRTRSGDASISRARNLVASLMEQGMSETEANKSAARITSRVSGRIDRNLMGVDRTMSKDALRELVGAEVGEGVAGSLLANDDTVSAIMGLGAGGAMRQKDLEAQLDSLEAGAADTRLDSSMASVTDAQRNYEAVLRRQGMLDTGLFGSKMFQGGLSDMTDEQKRVERTIRENYNEDDMLALSIYGMQDSNKDMMSLVESGQISLEELERLKSRGEQIFRGEFGNSEDARNAVRGISAAQYTAMGDNVTVAGIRRMNAERMQAGDDLARAQATAQLSEVSQSLGLTSVRSQEEFARQIGGLRKGSDTYRRAVDRLGQDAVDRLQRAAEGGGQFTSEQLDEIEAATKNIVDPGAEGVTTQTKSYSEAFNKDIRTQKDMIEVTRAVAASFGDSSKKFSDAVDRFANVAGSTAAEGSQVRGDQAAVYGYAGLLATTGVGIPAAALIAAANYTFND